MGDDLQGSTVRRSNNVARIISLMDGCKGVETHCEYSPDPLGFDSSELRLFWKLDDGRGEPPGLSLKGVHLGSARAGFALEFHSHLRAKRDQPLRVSDSAPGAPHQGKEGSKPLATLELSADLQTGQQRLTRQPPLAARFLLRPGTGTSHRAVARPRAIIWRNRTLTEATWMGMIRSVKRSAVERRCSACPTVLSRFPHHA
jgi:hypothetical protein